MGYDAAEQAYGEHRFAEAQALLNEHLTEQPNDPRAVLLQAYIHFYGFQDTAAAASSYRQVLELQTEGPCHDLALEGLKHCPVREREAKPAEPTVEPAQTKEPTDENERPRQRHGSLNSGRSKSKPSSQNQSQIRSLHRNRRRPNKNNPK